MFYFGSIKSKIEDTEQLTYVILIYEKLIIQSQPDELSSLGIVKYCQKTKCWVGAYFMGADGL